MIKREKIKAKSASRGMLLTNTDAKKTGWIAGMRWTEEPVRLQERLSFSPQDAWCLMSGSGPDKITGYVSPEGVTRGMRLYSLAAAFQRSVGGYSYGTYHLGGDKWVFLASVRGRISVMGDVVGSLSEVNAARSQFLAFNDSGSDEWFCVATPDERVSWQSLTRGIVNSQRKYIRVRRTSVLRPLILAVLLGVGLISALLWQQNHAMEIQRLADQARRQASKAIQAKSQEPEVAPHPWAHQLTVPVFLSLCWFTREPLPASVAGWRLTGGECDASGLLLHYEATSGSTVTDFARRASELLGHSARFNLEEGGKRGDVLIPFAIPDEKAVTRDESLPPANPQLMRFISHLQRRDVPVRFTEVKPPEVMPGQKQTQPRQDWREFTFSVKSRLIPEWLLAGCDDTGLRLTQIQITMSQQGVFAYIIKGSLYAQK